MAHRLTSLVATLALLGLAAALAGQTAPARATASWTVLSAAGRRALATTVAGDREMVGVDELASAFQLAVREDTLAGGLVVSYKGRTILLTPDQSLVSVSGRLVSLASPVMREGRRWLVPLDFISRALAPVYDAKLDLRRASRLVVVGDLRVPRVVVRVEATPAQAHVTLEIAPRTAQTVVQEAGRLLVRFEADALDASLATSTAPGLVEAVKVVDHATLAIDLGPRYGSYRASAPPSDPGPLRLAIDVMAATSDTPMPPGTPPAEPPAELPPALLAPPPPGIRTVVIDPGHGGAEEGARGPAGILEKDVVLGVARRLKSALESRLGIRVLLTRDGDNDIGLDERAAIANNNQADLFVSLHANASPRKDVQGAQVYYLSPEGYEAARQAGEPGPQTFATLGGGSREIDVILWDMAQARHLGESAALAGLVQEELRRQVPVNAKPVQQAPFRVLVGANMAAVLVEVGFLTNAGQEKQLQSPEFQTRIAQALFEAIVRFKEQVERGHAVQPAAAAPAIRPPSLP
jgi:N-acetylmuramoyl-L-alanine amidase